MKEYRAYTQGKKLVGQTFGHLLRVNDTNPWEAHRYWLYEMRKDGTSHNRGIAVPKDRGDLLRLVAMMLTPEFGELAAQAIVAELYNT